MLKKNLFISFSGGETSAFMTWWLLNNCKEMFENIVVCFANTGQEHENTLKFVNNCEKFFNFPVVWLEGVQNHNERKSADYRIVNFETADRTGAVFEDAIKKYGIPNQAFPHCTRSLKTTVLENYARKGLGWNKEDYCSAIGIRSDEIDRISSRYKEQNLIYPLISMFPMTKPQVNAWWSKQPFRLELTGYQGNCKWCWKKTARKHFTIMKENPEFFDFPDKMEKMYPRIGPEFRKEEKDASYCRTFFRGNKSVEDLRQEFSEIKDTFIPYHDENQVFDESLDIGGGCGESCEVYSDIDDRHA